MIEGVLATIERPDRMSPGKRRLARQALVQSQQDTSARQQRIAVLIAQAKDPTNDLEVRLRAGLEISAMEFNRRTGILDRHEAPEDAPLSPSGRRRLRVLSNTAVRIGQPEPKKKKYAGTMPKTVADARLLGASQYNTGKPCLHGHRSRRYTACGTCVECVKVAGKRKRAA
jgi:hypothetical protein